MELGRPRFIHGTHDYLVTKHSKTEAGLMAVDSEYITAHSCREALQINLGTPFAFVNVIACSENGDPYDYGICHHLNHVYIAHRIKKPS